MQKNEVVCWQLRREQGTTSCSSNLEEVITITGGIIAHYTIRAFDNLDGGRTADDAAASVHQNSFGIDTGFCFSGNASREAEESMPIVIENQIGKRST